MNTFRIVLAEPFYYSLKGNSHNSGKWGVPVYLLVNGVVHEPLTEIHCYVAKPTKKQLRQLRNTVSKHLIDELDF